ncbi:MAG: hypothetical protein HZA89_04760 [Verrucomicrobia bacterium]|nr:hypothetical protein [Verrucomicrobiota bacterium]
MPFQLFSQIWPGLRFRFTHQRVSWVRFGITLMIAGLLLGFPASGRGATEAIYVNLGNIVDPPIDATTIINHGTITRSTTPFQPLNLLNFSNIIGSFLVANAGVQLEHVTEAPHSRVHASFIVNQGTISGDTVLLSATNLFNFGDVRGGVEVNLTGNTVNLTRSVLSSSGGSVTSFASGGSRFVNISNGVVTYENPSAVADIYWGAGTGNVMRAATFGGLNLISLDSATGGFRAPQARSPFHEVEEVVGGIFGTLRRFPALSGTNYTPFVRATQSGTNVNIQVVLVQTNSANTNFSVDVRFDDSFFGAGAFAGDIPVVKFSTFGSDFTTGSLYTNNLYFLDYLNTLTNAVLSDNLVRSSSRPAAYELSRDSSLDSLFLPGFAFTTNARMSDIVYFQNGFARSVITNNFYAAYQAAVGNAASSPSMLTYNAQLDDPTNFPGRVFITANNLDMSLARIRADNLVNIRATNLISSVGTLIDAPNIQISIANTNSTLTLTNFATTQVARLNGTISFYSTVWTNALTNAVPELSFRYHVLMVDASQLSDITPVTLQEFSVRGTNVIINNILNIGRTIEVNSPSVTFNASSTLILPLQATTNLTSTNFPTVEYFTNLGSISVPFQCLLGSDRPTPITTFVNRGTLTANSIEIRALDYENSGTNLTRSLVSAASGGGGPISIRAGTAKFDGGLAGGMLSAGGSILLAANDLKFRNHRLITAGTLVLSPTNSLTDTGASGTNSINCALGFSLTVKPTSGDLLGTTFYTTAPFNRDVPHVWAGADLGPVAAGYTNNVAMGRLLLDTSNNVASINRLSFAGTGTSNALYVDYLDLAGTLTNDLSSHLFIETNMMIYFANANLPPETLDGQLGGRLRWVKDYAGLNTGVDVQLRDGRTVKVNVAKFNSPVLDSDADGIVNASDLNPFDGIVINSRVTFTNVPPFTAFVTWEAAAQTVYQVEVNTNLLAGTWRFLSNFTNSATTNRVVTFLDVVPAGGTERYFRISYQP